MTTKKKRPCLAGLFLLLGALLLSCSSTNHSQAAPGKQRAIPARRPAQKPATPPPPAVKEPKEAPEPVVQVEPGPVVTTAALRLRASASNKGEVRFTLNKGEPLALLRSEGGGDGQGEWAEVETLDFRRGWVKGASLEPLSGPKGERVRARSRFEPLDSETLPRLLAKRGLVGGKHLKILVIEIIPDGKGGFTYHPYDNGGRAFDRDNWWPASSIKLYAAVAALQVVRELGFSPRATATFQYEKKPRTLAVSRIVELALTPSNNRAFDRLVEIVGFDRINGRFFKPRNGFRQTVFLRSYARRVVTPETELGTPRHSPAIEFKERKKTASQPERHGKGEYKCPYQGNCTTPWELAETMRRVMMHEHLPSGEQFALGKPELKVLRKALSGKRSRGTSVVDALCGAFGGDKILHYNKPGYAYKWFSDNVFIHRPRTNQRWIVVIANHPGRDACDEAANHIGALLAKQKRLKHIK